jgi:hypothetical protein
MVAIERLQQQKCNSPIFKSSSHLHGSKYMAAEKKQGKNYVAAMKIYSHHFHGSKIS